MDRTKNLRESYMDGEALFRHYFAMGDGASFAKLQGYAVRMNMSSPEGNPPTMMGLWKAMWRWASLRENKETAFAIYKEVHPSVTQGEWNVMMMDKIRKAWQYRTDARYNKFLRDNGWL